MSIERETWVCVAAVATAHGVRGALKLRCFTENPEDVAAYGPVYDEQGHRLFTLSVIASAKGGVIVKAEGVDDRESAEALRGQELFVPRSKLPELEDDDEFYYSDLEGLVAARKGGERFGLVKRVTNHGAGDLLDIAGDDGEHYLIPFDHLSVPVIDLEAGFLEIADRLEITVNPDDPAQERKP